MPRISSSTHSATNSSKTFDKHGVSDIGRKSLSSLGGDSFGIGVIFAAFQISGATHEDRETLKISVTGSVSS